VQSFGCGAGVHRDLDEGTAVAVRTDQEEPIYQSNNPFKPDSFNRIALSAAHASSAKVHHNLVWTQALPIPLDVA
jgi:hypothetical protein